MIKHIVLMKMNDELDDKTIAGMRDYAARIREQIAEARSYDIVLNEASEATNPTDLQEAGHLNRTNAGASNRAAQTPRIETVPTVRIGPIVVNLDGTTAHEEAAQT